MYPRQRPRWHGGWYCVERHRHPESEVLAAYFTHLFLFLSVQEREMMTLCPSEGAFSVTTKLKCWTIRKTLTNWQCFLTSFFFFFFLAALGLRCCAWAFSSCGEQGLPFLVVWRLLIAVASLVAECGLSSYSARALGHAGFSSCGVWAQ